MRGPLSSPSRRVSSQIATHSAQLRRPGPPCWLWLGLTLAALGLCSTPGHAALPREPVGEYLKGRGTAMCEELYEQLRPVIQAKEPAAAPNPKKDPWLWPAWLFLAAKCSSQPSYDAPYAGPASEKLFQAGSADCALLTVLLGAYCHILAAQTASAYELLRDAPARAAEAKKTEYTADILALIRQCRVYCEFGWHKDRVLGVSTRPGIILAPFDARLLRTQVTDRDIDEDGTSAAVTWLVLETMRRIVATFPLPADRRPLTIDEDLALRFADGRVCGVNSTFDQPQAQPGRNFNLANYMTKLRASGKHFVAGYISTDNDSTRLSMADLLAGSDFRAYAAVQNPLVPGAVSRSSASPLKHFFKMGDLTRSAAFEILKDFYDALPDSFAKPTKLREEWIPIPNNEDFFWNYVEAVGYEARGNYGMAIRRYRELIADRPGGTPDSQMEFVKQRLERCDALYSFDTPARFFRNNEPALRKIILANVD